MRLLLRWRITTLWFSVEVLSYFTKAILLTCPQGCNCEGVRISCFHSMPAFLPRDITKVTIHGTHLGELMDFSDPGWRNITDLTITTELSNFKKHQEAYKVLHENELIALQSLKVLKIICRCLKKIQSNAFRGLTNLTILDLSDNTDMSADSIVQGLTGDDILPNLKELYLSNIPPVLGIILEGLGYDEDLVNKTGHEFLEAVKNKPLKVLDITRSKNDWFYWEYFIYMTLPHLKMLNVSNTSTTDTFYSNVTLRNTLSLHVLAFMRNVDMHLKTIDISYPSLEFPMTMLTNRMRLNTYVLHLAPFNLTEIYAKGILGYPSKVYGVTNASMICIAFFHVIKEKEVCLGTKRIRYLDKLVISENSVTYFEPSFWDYFHALRHLDIARNNIGYAFSKEGYAKSILGKLEKLEVFIASENNITYLPAETFQNNKYLKILDLAMNRLKSITFKTEYLLSLVKLDLSHNNIMTLERTDIERLRYLQMTTNQSNLSDWTLRNMSLQITLKGNPFICTCTTTPFLYWLATLNESNTCVFSSEQKTIDMYLLPQIEYHCKETIVITVFSIFGFVTTLLLSIMICLILREVQKQQRRKGIYMGIELYRINRDERQTLPVFLSFCTEDDEIAMEAIYPHLDTNLKNILNTDARCVATGGTDFRPGYSLTDEIIRCVEASSVVIFFVTNAFCETLWCKNETLVAHYDKKPIILMLWEKVDPRLMPHQLYKHYKELDI